MNNELIVLAVIVLVFWGGILLLRIPAFAVLFSLLVGEVLSTKGGEDAYRFASGVSGVAQFQYIQIALLVLPLILTAVFLKGRVQKSKIVYEVVPALFGAITLLLLLYPLVPVLKNTMDMALNDQIDRYGSISLIIASILGLVSVWISFPKGNSGSKHEK